MNTRRDFLKTAALAGTAPALLIDSAPAANPIDRPFGPRMKLSLAAYSCRSLLETNPTQSQLAGAAMTLEGFIDFCASLGLDGTELTGYYFPRFVQDTSIYRPPIGEESLSPQQRQERIDKAVNRLNMLKNRAFRLGLDISGSAIGNNFCLPEGPELVAQINYCKNWIDRAFVLGAPVIRIFAGRVPKKDTLENTIQRCAAAIGECLDYASRRGVYLALENHGGITADPATMLKLIEAVPASPWFGVNFDSGNFHTDDPYSDMALIAPYAVNAQIKVSVAPNGKKQPADFARIIEILRGADYRGYLVLEYEEKGAPLTEIPKYIKQLRQLIT